MPLVKYETVRLGADAEGSTYAAAVRGRYETVLAFQVGGRIASRTVQLGDRVRAGEVLMTLDPKDIAQTARQSAAQVEAARQTIFQLASCTKPIRRRVGWGSAIITAFAATV